MIKNYFIVAWRNLRKSKLTSFINIFGLTISIGICLLITLFINDEINYDKFETNFENVYRLEQMGITNGVPKRWAASPAPLQEVIQQSFPEVECSSRLLPSPYAFINVGDKKFKEENCFLVDSAFFKTLGLSLIEGDPEKALAMPDAVVISEKMALKMFGTASVLGKTLEVNANPFRITGIMKDLPPNSHLQIEVLRSISLQYRKDANFTSNWFANTLYTYIRVKKGSSAAGIQDKLAGIFMTSGLTLKKEDLSFIPHELAKIHLDGNSEKELFPNSSWTFIYIFISVGFLVLLLASINYINLTTSRSLERSKEIGVRKALGAYKSNLVVQFLTESVLVTLISFGIGLLVVYVSLPAFNSIIGKHLSISSIVNPFFLLISVGILFFIGILAGIYPALGISSFDPVSTLKGVNATNLQSRFSFGLRKALVVFQFVISAFLVISSIAVIQQLNYMFDKPLGYTKENVMVIPSFLLNDATLSNLRNELSSQPNIKNVSATSAVPGKRVILGGAFFPGIDVQQAVRTMFVDHDYLKTMNVQLVQGRFFDRSMINDTIGNVIVNEAMVKAYNLKEPVGMNMAVVLGGPGIPARIVGVVKDFHQGSLHNSIEPTQFVIKPIYYSLTVRFTGDVEKAKKTVAAAWTKTFPSELFTYTLLEDDLKTLYRTESTLKNVLIVFTLLGILIAALGLFGLIYFSNTLRKKEIGIRKVLGANNPSVIYILSKGYIVLIVISLAISIPLSKLALSLWLNNFAYRTEVSVWTFVIGIAVTAIIAFLTIFIQGMRSASASPVKNLRTE